MGAPLLAFFEKWVATLPKPLASAVRCRWPGLSQTNPNKRMPHPCAFCAQEPALSEAEGVGFHRTVPLGIGVAHDFWVAQRFTATTNRPIFYW